MRKSLILITVLSWSLLVIVGAASATEDPLYFEGSAPPADVIADLEPTDASVLDVADAPAMYFPVVGEREVDFDYYDTYGAPRSGGRTHEGVDIGTYGVKGVPIVAAAAGTIYFVNWSTDPNDLNPEKCCSLTIDHEGGWSTWYIHMDNDTPGTDDGLGWGIAPGIVPGATVYAGQLIGWVGDSGNAEGVYPMLHWEVHEPGGADVNPTPFADAATILSAPLEPGEDPPAVDPPADDPPADDPPVEDPPVVVAVGTFIDDDDSVHQANIEIIAELGITKGCNPPDNDKYCPQNDITRGQIAAFIRRMLDLPASTMDAFTDDGESIFEDDINAVTEAGIGFGCTDTDFCPDEPLHRDEMAEFLVRAFGYSDRDAVDAFVDDESSPFQESINVLAAEGITKGCNPPDNDEFCPDRTLSRAEMATFFARALGLGT